FRTACPGVAFVAVGRIARKSVGGNFTARMERQTDGTAGQATGGTGGGQAVFPSPAHAVFQRRAAGVKHHPSIAENDYRQRYADRSEGRRTRRIRPVYDSHSEKMIAHL